MSQEPTEWDLPGADGKPRVITGDKACAAVATAERQRDFRVPAVPGLMLRVTEDGTKTWTLRFRDKFGKKPRFNLGHYPATSYAAACKRARETMGQVDDGINPAAAKRELREGATFGDVFDYWLEMHATPNLVGAENDRKRYRLHIEPLIGALPVKALERADIVRVRDKVHNKGTPVEANRCLALVNRVLNFAVDAEKLKYNPGHRIKKAAKELPRERVLSDDELAKLWHALAEIEAWHVRFAADSKGFDGSRGRPMDMAMVRAIRILILTGQRRTEVIGTHSRELDLQAGDWTISGDRSKNDLVHLVPLAPLALFEFRRAMADAGRKGPVFPSPEDRDAAMRGDAVTKALQRLCKRLKLDGVGPHDLRRTANTGMAKLRIPESIRARVLNHTKGAKSSITSRVYDKHDYRAEKLEALGAWEAQVSVIVGRVAGPNVTAIGG